MGFNRASTNIFSSSVLPSLNVISLQAKDTIFIKSNIVASSTKAALQEIYTTNYTFSITDEDDNILNLNGQDVIFSICCYEYNNSLELLKNDILINNIQKLMN